MVAVVRESGLWRCRFTIETFDGDWAPGAAPIDVIECGNMLMHGGVSFLWQCALGLGGAGALAYLTNTTAAIGVGDATTAAVATQTDLQAVRSRTAWAASTAYAAGAFVRPTSVTDTNELVFECTTAGTSAATEPTWPTADAGTVTDGTVTWTGRKRKFRKGMDAGYPAHTDGTASANRTITLRATYGTTEANIDWQEVSVHNALASGAGRMLNRRTQAIGVKSSSVSRIVTATISID